jgi:diacylglycerol kinase family enzyme
VNASSGRHLHKPAARQKLEALCSSHATLWPVGSHSALLEQMRQLPDRPNLQVGILGGDGTHMRVMSALFDVFGPSRLPTIVPVPFGTVSTICRRWGAGTSPWRVLSAWLDRQPMALRRQESLLVTLDEGQNCIACTVGTGLVAQFFEHYESLGAPGLTSAAHIALQSFFGSFVASPLARTIMKPLVCSVAVESQPVSPRVFSLIVSSVFKDVGLGIKVTYRAGDEPEKIALVTSSLPAQKLGPQFWRVLTGRPLVDPQGIDRLVGEWSLSFNESGPVIVDGDRLNVRTLRVRPGPSWSVLTRR